MSALSRSCDSCAGALLARVDEAAGGLDPSFIVIGRGVAQSGDALIEAVSEVVHGRSLPLATRLRRR